MSVYKYFICSCFCIFFTATVANAANSSTGSYAELIGVLEGKLDQPSLDQSSLNQQRLDQPSDVVIDDDGRAYVLDGINGRVVVFNSDGKQDFIFGKSKKTKQQLNLPMGIAIADKQIYIADSGNHRIVLFNLRGQFLKSFPLTAPSPKQSLPEPVALIVNDGVITWSDRRNHRICRTAVKNGEELRCWGKRGEGKNELQFPYQLSMDRDDYINVVDVLNGRVQVFNQKGRRFTTVGRFGTEPDEFFRPNGLAFSAKNELLVSDVFYGTVSLYRNGRFVSLLNDKQGKAIHVETPVALTVWKDRLYVVEALKNRVVIFRLQDTNKEPVKTERNRQKSTSQKNCVSCHLSWAENYVPGENEQDGVPPVATPRMCYSCHHGVVIDSRQSIGQGEQHPDIHHQRKEKDKLDKKEREKERDDEIPEAFPLLSAKLSEKPSEKHGAKIHSAKKQLSCGSCHTPHTAETEDAETLDDKHENPWLRVLNKDGDLCQQCHESKLESSIDKKYPLKGINHPVGIFLKKPPKPNAKGFATNKKLHDGLPDKLLKNGASLGQQQQMICQSCHQVHGSSEESLTVLPMKDGELCKQCHPRQHADNKKQARKKGVHPVNIDLDEPVKMGDEEIKRVTCLSCHSLHAAKEGTPLLKSDHRDGKLCSYCHDDYDAVVNSDHDLRITAKKSKNRFAATPKQTGACGACHTLHQGEAKAPSLFAGELHEYSGKEPILEQDKLCLNCHRKEGLAEKAVVKHLSHPSKDLVLHSDPKIMPLVDGHGAIKKFGAIACITCHNPHRWKPKEKNSSDKKVTSQGKAKNQPGNVLNSFLRRKGAKGTFCIDCHGIEARLKYKYYHDEFSRDAAVDYIK